MSVDRNPGKLHLYEGGKEREGGTEEKEEREGGTDK